MDPSKTRSTHLDVPSRTELHEIDLNDKSSLLTCPKCNHFISGKDINVESTIAKCGHCDHVFGFEYDSKTEKLRSSQLIPDGIEVLKLRSELDMRLKWIDTTSKGGRAFITLFAGFWNLMVLPFALFALLSGAWQILLFLSLHLIVGLGLLWHLACVYMNRTSISVTKHKLKVRTFPIRHFLWKNKEIDVNSIEQLYVTKYVESTTNGNPNYAYALYAILDDHSKVALLSGMNRPTQVYIEREIENYLGIKNRKVPEENSGH